jgi:8-oxo-dGTP pyrophosphatase MutT (NUDIX family)
MRGYWFIVRPRFFGAYVGVWHADRILIIKNSYKKAYTVPCGKIQRGETAVAAAARELAEEVGIDLKPEQLVLAAQFMILNESKKDHISFFEATFDRPPTFQVDNREVVWAQFLTVAEAKQLPLSPVVLNYLSRRTV